MRSIGRSAQLVLVYCLADDGLKSERNGGNWRKSNHNPKCTDAEIMAVAMMQSYFGTATLKRTYLLIKANDAQAFPHLPSYKQWLARLHNLSFQMGAILENVPLNIEESDEIYLIDSFPINMCQPIRHRKRQFIERSRSLFRERNERLVFWFQIARFINTNGANSGSNFVANRL